MVRVESIQKSCLPVRNLAPIFVVCGTFAAKDFIEETVPKVKTKKAAAKRFKRTATGKIKRRKAFKTHILTKKNTKRKRRLRKSAIMSKAERRKTERMLQGQ